MLEIRINGEPLDLPAGLSVELEDTNPIFNERGSQSVPATVPTTITNQRLLGFPTRIDTGICPNKQAAMATVIDGAYMRRGAVNITSAGRAEGITFNIGFDNSAAYMAWQDRKLSELGCLPTYKPREQPVGFPIDWLLDELYRIYRTPDSLKDDFAVFPIAVNTESIGTDAEKKVYWELFNRPGSHGLAQPSEVNRVINGELTKVSVPEGYCVSPFLRVWRILELIFEDLELRIVENPFETNIELSRLVVLNNAADSVCRGEIRYADLMPDCTVAEFLNALWVRFGLVYNIDLNTRRVSMRFLRDIINASASFEFIDYSSGPEIINYEEAQYVKLSAKSSIEGAAPACDRFEDFVKGLDIGDIRLGADVKNWTFTSGSDGRGQWLGDVRDDFWDPDNPDAPDPDYPDPDTPGPDEDRDPGDNRNDFDDSGLHDSRSADARETSVESSGSLLAREFVSGMWYKLDSSNGTVRLSSSSFFNWDPQTDGLSAFDLSSDDEFVPVVDLGLGYPDAGLYPTYLFGARHYHSYIKGSDDAENTGDSTPLAFMFAYTMGQKTYGRLTPEGEDGQRVTLDDGSQPTISLLFQFKDGLFARFWACFDEVLRHGNRTIEVPALIPRYDYLQTDILQPVVFRGVRCIIDTMNYTLPARKEIDVDVKLRTITTHGSYDIAKEQNIPAFSSSARHLEWFLVSDSFSSDALGELANRQSAANKYIQQSDYTSHGTEGDYWYIAADSAIPKTITRAPLTWQNDATRPAPTYPGLENIRYYKAILTYDIYEIHDMSYQDGPTNWELGDDAIGSISVETEYQIKLVARWVSD